VIEEIEECAHDVLLVVQEAEAAALPRLNVAAHNAEPSGVLGACAGSC
jgi:hypothetical protein